MSDTTYLRPNVVMEPLIDSWYAWPHLVSPATAAMNIVKRHLNIMESYISNPEAHALAVQNPRMLGGPFMDYGRNRVDDVRALMDATLRERADMIELAKAIRSLDSLLQAEAGGSSLEQLYPRVPEILKGYVELVYDLNNVPSFRLFESLLYRSRYYRPASQSIAFWVTNNDHRPFCLSTPRLEEDHVLRLNIPFAHEGIDELARMKRTAGRQDKIAQLLGVPLSRRDLFSSFFIEETPAPYRKYEGDKIRIRYFGHACILVETKDVSVLLDPLISYYGYHSDVEHFSDIDLPDVIDYAIITHNHQDHILFETLLPLRHKIRHLIIPRARGGRLEDPNLGLMFRYLGFRNVVELDEMETIEFSDTVITGIPFTGEHCDLNIQTKLCYHLRIGVFSLLFMADSRVVAPDLYKHVYEVIGKVDVIFLGMECDGAPLSWLYGPLMLKKVSREQDSTRRLAGCDCEKGMSLVETFGPQEIYVYAMGQEPWLEFISSLRYTDKSNPIVQSNMLIEECMRRNIIAERLYGEKEILYETHREAVL